MSYILLASEVIDLEDIDDLSDEAYEKFTAKIETRIQEKGGIKKKATIRAVTS